MAKRRRKVLRARKEQRHDDSLLIRSAESLGRVIGSLQRQMQGSSKRVSSLAGDAIKSVPELPQLDKLFGGTDRSTRKRAGAGAAGARKSKKATRTGGARASSAARKASGSRKRAGAKPSRKR